MLIICLIVANYSLKIALTLAQSKEITSIAINIEPKVTAKYG